ncbi:cysteine desulfurase family protein (TIGR01976 family) [Catenuloplanes nepalensis]|uniref:Cysteine desulfurase family protein (TIGR01976 family) n=1 Tax=Catenuloplanes nepalensis TaxID=587533 RepID=A0ABT9MY15_9ACTN|nr:cysteine desulfurase-like protein [Catenuloplanes nepalensis]MDP9796331.1 cysteine desulfurase family protein (TIGR01976 family) [Catenuloplanes nepalensis]
MPFDVDAIRSRYPALAEGYLHFDNAGGSQVAAPVADAVAATMRAAVSNRSAAFEPGRRSGEIVAAARHALADLLGAAPQGIVLGPSATALTYRVARALADTWQPGDEIVVSRLDHDANVRPWVQLAARAGATVRWAEFDRATGDLPAAQFRELTGERTRLVALTAGSNANGAAPDVAAITAIARAAGALTYVDAVHSTPHLPARTGADFVVTSAYKWSGPHLAAVAADPALWERLRPMKLAPSSEAVPDRFELGTASFEQLAGVTAAVEHLADLAAGGGDRRSRLGASFAEIQRYETALLTRLLDGLATLPGVTVLPAPDRRCPTVSFRLADQPPSRTAALLGERNICLSAGDYYAYEFFEALGLRDSGGAVRASLYHYNTEAEVDTLLNALSDLHG